MSLVVSVCVSCNVSMADGIRSLCYPVSSGVHSTKGSRIERRGGGGGFGRGYHQSGKKADKTKMYREAGGRKKKSGKTQWTR